MLKENKFFDNPEFIALFKHTFRGRQDIVAQKGKNGKYFPLCRNVFKRGLCGKPYNSNYRCDSCKNRRLQPLTDKLLKEHFEGRYIRGIYPLLLNNTCHFVAVDFDNHEGDKNPYDEAREFYEVCACQEIPCYLLRSQSGTGYHAYIFFEQPISAAKARKVTLSLLDEAQCLREESFDSFDRIFPNQDSLYSQNAFGNLIAYPFQGKATQQGHTLFLDPDTGFRGPYEDQIDTLLHLNRATEAQIESVANFFDIPWDELPQANADLSLQNKHDKTLSNAAISSSCQSAPAEDDQISALMTCDFFRWAYHNQPEVKEPLWYALLSNLSRSRSNGPRLCHRFSERHPGYSQEETDRKILMALNGSPPHTCDYVKANGFACKKDCGVKSPIGLFNSYKCNTPGALKTDHKQQPEKTKKAPTAKEKPDFIDALPIIDLFHKNGAGYVSLNVNNHIENYPINSKHFSMYVRRQIYYMTKGDTSSPNLNELISTLDAKALFEGDEEKIYTRVAGFNGSVYIDLANDKWESIEITPSEWRIISNPPVQFIRHDTTNPLPYPEKGGSIDLLRHSINCPDEDTWKMIVAWLLGALQPEGPFPILAVHGEQGSAKSTLCEICHSVIDPSESKLRALPRSIRDLMIASSKSRILSFDNLSKVDTWLSDAFCRLSTGGSFSTREVYSNDGEISFNTQLPVILNGINNIATRADLADRTIIVNLPYISSNQRKTRKHVMDLFKINHPKILGALCDGVSTALRNQNAVHLPELCRMADFSVWATAAETAFWNPGDFMKAYRNNRSEGIDLSIEAHTIGNAMLSFMNHQKSWNGTATELLTELREDSENYGEVDSNPYWPKSSQRLINELQRLKTVLRARGISIDLSKKSNRGREVRINKIPVSDQF